MVQSILAAASRSANRDGFNGSTQHKAFSASQVGHQIKGVSKRIAVDGFAQPKQLRLGLPAAGKESRDPCVRRNAEGWLCISSNSVISGLLA